MVETLTGRYVFEVSDVKISFSIVGNLLIAINVVESDDFPKIKAGDSIYVIND